MSDKFSADVRFLRCVFLVERSGIFSKVSADLTLLFLRQECAWARSPEELLESIKDLFLEFPAPVIPDRISVLELLGNIG